jgi:hypothetical protein
MNALEAKEEENNKLEILSEISERRGTGRCDGKGHAR